MPPVRGSLRARFLAVARPFFHSENRWRATAVLVLLLTFILGIAGLNIVANGLSGRFVDSVEGRDSDWAVRFALLWAGVFVCLTVTAVFKAFTEERFRLWWRSWLTRHLFERYLAGRAYYRMKGRTDVDNPDQRITEDVRTFTEQSLAMGLILTQSAVNLVCFSGVLWSVTPWLVLAAVLYTVFGSAMTIFLGHKLMKLDVKQYKKEADLRYDLIQVRAHAEQISLLGGEAEEAGWLRRGLGAVVENMKCIIGLSRNINFFTTGFDYLVQLIPLAIVAPFVIRGEAGVGDMWKAQSAFAFVVASFSVIVKEFQRISTFGAVTERLGTFCEVLDDEAQPPGGGPGAPDRPAGTPPIEVVEDGTRIAFEGLTLVTPREGRLLVKDLSLEVPRGRRLVILGPSGTGRTTLLRAAAGLWTAGHGRVVRPPRGEVMFLPQQPYLRPGPLRGQLLYGTGREVPDERILDVLHQVGFDKVLERVGGLGAERDWPNTLSLGEQQQVAFARLLLAAPRFAFLDEPTSALDPETARHLYEILAETPITYVSVASDPALAEHHDRVLELGRSGAWAASGEPELASA
jgi:putative ATP-binding cassette transporter